MLINEIVHEQRVTRLYLLINKFNQITQTQLEANLQTQVLRANQILLLLLRNNNKLVNHKQQQQQHQLAARR